MNKISLTINIILAAAIGYLYFYNFSAKKNTTVAGTSVGQMLKDSCTTQHRIAYVELDSLNENLVYFKQKRKELELQQKQIESKIASDYKSLEEKQNNFRQKNPSATPEDYQKFQGLLMQEQQEIEMEKQKQSQFLNQKSFELMESIQKKLKQFLADYNKEKKYQYILTTGSGIDYLIYKDSTLDITKDVIKGMNEIMKPVAQ